MNKVKNSNKMKTLLILLALIAGSTLEGRSEKTKTGEHESATANTLSLEQEAELLKEYFPSESTLEASKITVQIYDVSLRLIMEAQINPMEETENQELGEYLRHSDLLMNIGNKSLYMLER